MGAIERLKRLTGKRHVVLTRRGDQAILISLRIAKARGATRCLIADQGGWISYPSLASRAGLIVETLATDHGVFEPNPLSTALDGSSVLLVHSMAGYFAEQPMGLLMGITRQKNALLINDCSSTIGTESAKIGDMVVCSFADDKPIDLGTGGCLAYDADADASLLSAADFDTRRSSALEEKLAALPERLRAYEQTRSRLLKRLEDLPIIHRRLHGINVVVGFSNLAERERIIKAAEREGLEWEECPIDHKVKAHAISIEVKRL